MSTPKVLALEELKALQTVFSDLNWEAISGRKSFFQNLVIQKFKKGWRLLNQGESVSSIGFVLEGLFKLQRLGGDGKHSIFGFPCEGEILSDYSAWFTLRPAEFTIEALEPGKVVLIPEHLYGELLETEPTWAAFGEKQLKKAILHLSQREFSMLHLDATARYEKFVAEHGPLMGRLKLKDLAAYLGITPVSFSRMSAQRMIRLRECRSIDTNL